MVRVGALGLAGLLGVAQGAAATQGTTPPGAPEFSLAAAAGGQNAKLEDLQMTMLGTVTADGAKVLMNTVVQIDADSKRLRFSVDVGLLDGGGLLPDDANMPTSFNMEMIMDANTKLMFMKTNPADPASPTPFVAFDLSAAGTEFDQIDTMFEQTGTSPVGQIDPVKAVDQGRTVLNGEEVERYVIELSTADVLAANPAASGLPVDALPETVPTEIYVTRDNKVRLTRINVASDTVVMDMIASNDRLVDDLVVEAPPLDQITMVDVAQLGGRLPGVNTPVFDTTP